MKFGTRAGQAGKFGIDIEMNMAFNNCFQNKKVIITGNTGFKGSWLTLWLNELGAKITGISKDIPTNPSLFAALNLESKIDHHFINICDYKAVEKLVIATEPDFVFHLAAQPIVSISYEDPIDTFQSNIIGTANILEALRKLNHHCQAIMITSDKCYDNVEWAWGYRESDPLGGKDPYSASKGAAELIIKTYYHSYFGKPNANVKVVSVRAGNVIGGGDWATSRIVPDCMRAWSSGKKVIIRNPNSTRPWQHVLEPLSGYLCAAQELIENNINLNGESFNFGPNSDQNHTVLEVLKSMANYWSDLRNADFSVESNSSFHEAGLLKLNCDKALSKLYWKPVLEFADTAKLTGQWYNKYYNAENKGLYDFTTSQISLYYSKAKEKGLKWAK